MKKSKLIELLYSADEEDVTVEVDGLLYDISPELGHEEERFDGFCSVSPATVFLRLTDEENEE